MFSSSFSAKYLSLLCLSYSQDIESWIAGAGPAGVIYFSLGSLARGDSMLPEYLQVFLETFRRLPQRVLWKYEGELKDASDNVMVSSWLPQQDILGKSATPSQRVTLPLKSGP